MDASHLDIVLNNDPVLQTCTFETVFLTGTIQLSMHTTTNNNSLHFDLYSSQRWGHRDLHGAEAHLNAQGESLGPEDDFYLYLHIHVTTPVGGGGGAFIDDMPTNCR